MALKRAARGHDPLGIKATPKGALTIACPACPQPGWNIPDDWDKCPPEKRLFRGFLAAITNSRIYRWIYTLFIALDACFRLKNKDRKIKDPEMGSGWGYFVEEESYKQHIESYVEIEEVGFSWTSLMHRVWTDNTDRLQILATQHSTRSNI